MRGVRADGGGGGGGGTAASSSSTAGDPFSRLILACFRLDFVECGFGGGIIGILAVLLVGCLLVDWELFG